MKSSIPIHRAQRACRAFFLIVVLAMVALAPAHAQEAGGTILGTVVDPKGDAVAGATISIRNVETGVERTTTANGDGLYSAPNLQAGSCDVSVTATGFSVTSVQPSAFSVQSSALN